VNAVEGSPPIAGVLETVLHCTSENEEATRSFYTEVLGFRSIGQSSFRAGPDVLLLFNSDKSSVQDEPPPHGASGAVHVCFVTTPDSYTEWKAYLGGRDVELGQEISWDESGGHSFYFEDPAGNLLEIADGDLWPPSGASTYNSQSAGVAQW
jgi:catechol 2,3-dioxygenase-like lactoylglutathione lyase family enzyme